MKYVFKELVQRAKNQGVEAKEEIITSLRPLILSSMSKYAASYRDNEELFQEGCARILELIEEYDEKRGVPFLGYIKINLKYFYMNYSKKSKIIIQSLDRKIENKDNDKITLIDLLKDDKPLPLEEYIEKEMSAELLQAISKLTAKYNTTLLF